MSTWQDIFAGKIEEMHITDPWTLLEDDSLQVQACKPGWKEFVQHRALGRFQCSQCFRKWSSSKVHILFHMCWCQGWGTVRMRVFRQECRHCPKPRLEDPEFSLETIETILHNLVIKILQYFYKKPVQPSDLLEVVVDTPVTGPHDRAHCEACKLGVCNRSQRAPALDAWNANVSRTCRTLKYQRLRPHATSTHHLSTSNSNFPWKRCCCIGSSLLCVLALIIFVVLYLTMMQRDLGGSQGRTGAMAREADGVPGKWGTQGQPLLLAQRGFPSSW